ncbi:GNAT family N-acetyltransferase [Nocardiopsis alba]|uniref:GNAT family N-acetyltransferase n=1 Tax=Nocardiopsis alba TaxID=53437 RepID=UPI0035DE8945
MRPRGHRSRDAHLLQGYWTPDHLVSFPDEARDELLDPETVPLPGSDPSRRLFVVEETAVIRFVEIEPVHRRARVVVGLAPGAEEDAVDVLISAVAVGFGALNLHRLHGRLLSRGTRCRNTAKAAGFRHEGTIPQGMWLGGARHDMEIWGILRDEH